MKTRSWLRRARQRAVSAFGASTSSPELVASTSHNVKATNRNRAGSAATREAERRRYVLEAVEPRLLLSASAFYSAEAASAGVSMTLSTADRQGVQTLLLSDAQGAELASAALASLHGPVVIIGSVGDDTLKVDASAAAAGVALAFDAGAGRDTIFGSALDTQWKVTGADTGSAQAGSHSLHFSGVEQLTGAADNRDVFTLAAAGSLSLGLDGGARGDDAMVFEATAVARAIYEAFGPDSGLVTHDGRVTRFAGLEPIVDQSVVANRVFTATNAADQIRVFSNLDGTSTIRSDNITPSFESLTFLDAGTQSLVINTGTGADTLNLELVAALSGGLTVNSTDSLSISRINLAGDITVKAGQRISTTPQALISAGNGNVTLSVTNTTELNWAAGLAGFKDKSAAAVIDLDSATVVGRNIKLDALASTTKLAEVKDELAIDTHAVVMADFNGDGRLDLAQADFDGGVRLFLHNGSSNPFDGVASQVVGRNAAGGPLFLHATALAAGDVNGDGKIDLLVGNDIYNSWLFINSGSPGTPFQGATQVELGNLPGVDEVNLGSLPGGSTFGLALADVNQDGRLDAVVARNGGARLEPVQVFLNDGSATGLVSVGRAIGEAQSNTTALAVGDVDGDGRTDVVLGRASGGPLLYRNLDNSLLFGGLPARGTVLGDASGANTAVALADFNGDGRRDLVVGYGNRAAQLFLNTGNTAQLWVGRDIGSLDDGAVSAIAVGDLNSDGLADLVLGRSAAASRVYLNNGETSVATGSPFRTDSGRALGSADIVAPVVGLALGDLNGDGRADLVLGNASALSEVYTHNGRVGAGDSPFTETDYGVVNPDSSLVQRIDESAGFGKNLFGAVVLAKANATVTVGSNSSLQASGNVDINATALANAQNTTVGFGLAFTAATIDSSARAVVGTGARINAAGQVTLQADTVNVLKPSALAISPGVVNLSVAYGKLLTSAVAEVQGLASVTGSNLVVRARNDNIIDTSASGYNLSGSTGPSGAPIAAGVSVAIGDYTSTARASVLGQATLSGNLTVDARSADRENVNSAAASVLNPPTKLAGVKDLASKSSALTKAGTAIAGGMGPISAKILGGIGNALSAGATPSVSAAGGITVLNSSHDARALIGSGAVVRTAGNADVQARAEDGFRAYATGSASDSESVAIGGAISVATVNNNAYATIEQNAAVDVAGVLHLLSNAVVPNPVQSTLPALQFNPPADTTGSPNSSPADRVDNGFRAASSQADSAMDVMVDGVTPFITGVLLGNAKSVGTTYTQGSGSPKSGGSAGISGAVNVLNVTNNSLAGIGRGARVNQGFGATRPAGQDVWVEALSTLITIDLAGQASLLSIKGLVSGSETTAGVGGDFTWVNHTGYTQAFIDDDAKVSAGRDIRVTANSLNYLMAVSLQGSNAGSVAVNGAITFTNVDQLTQAWVEDGATLDATRDIAVRAGSTLSVITADGAIGIGAAAGVGIGIAVNLVPQHNTRAFIGDGNGFTSGAVLPATAVTAGRDLAVSAGANEQLWVIAAAGGVATAGVDKPKPSGPDLAAMLRSPAFDLAALKKATEGQQYGFGLSGAVAVNQMNGLTEAFVKTPRAITTAAAMTVGATDTSLLVQGAGAFGVGREAGVGGAVTVTDLSKTTVAYVQGPRVRAGTLAVTSRADELLVGAAAGAASAKETAAVAGSVNVSRVLTNTQARLADNGGLTARFDMLGDVRVDAAHKLYDVSVAGALSIGLGAQAAVGAAVDVSVIDTQVVALVGVNAPVTADGNVLVQAANTETARKVAASVAVSPSSGVGASGSVAASAAKHAVLATSLSNIGALGQVRIDADDTTDRLVVAGSAGGGKTAGVGLSVGVAVLERTVQAGIGAGVSVGASNLTGPLPDPQGGGAGGRGVTVEATATDSLVLFVAGGAGGGNAGVAVSAAIDKTTGAVDAFIGAGARVSTANLSGAAAPDVTVRANEARNHLVIGGAAAGASQAGVGAVAASSTLSSVTTAHIDSSATAATRVQSAGALTVDAATLDTTTVVAVGVAGGGSGAGAGSVAVLTRQATTTAWVGNSANLTVAGSARIAADGDLSADVAAGAGAIGGQGGVGAANATVLDTTRTSAYIDALSTLTVSGGTASALYASTGNRDAGGRKTSGLVAGLSVTATQRDKLRPVTVGVGGGGTAGVAASVTYTELNNTTEAYIASGARITAEQNVNLLATNDTDVLSVAGGAAGAGVAGVGAGADAGQLNQWTRAYLGALGTTVTATKGDVLIRALSSENLLSVSAAGAAGGTVGVAGAVGVWLVNDLTHAVIDNRATVVAEGHVLVAADDQSSLLQVAGSLGAGGAVGVGAAVGASTVTKNTLAGIADSAAVTARGNTAAIQVATGRYETAGGRFVPASAVDSAADTILFLSNPHRLVDGQAVVYRNGGGASVGGLADGQTYYVLRVDANRVKLAASQADALAGRFLNLSAVAGSSLHSLLPAGTVPVPVVDNPDLVANDGSGRVNNILVRRALTPTTEAFSGLAVTATSRETVETYAVSGGGGGTASVQVAGAGHRSVASTVALIGANVAINANNSGANAAQSVRVLSADNIFHLGVGGAAGVAGVVAVSPGVDAVVVRNSTTATVGDGTVINARQDLALQALAEENLLSFSIGLAGGGTAAVSGAVSVLSVDNRTQALLGGSGASAAPSVNVGGNASVVARDLTATGIVSGAGAVGGVGAGFGAAVGLTQITKDTQAQIGRNAVVNALGISTRTLSAYEAGSDILGSGVATQRSFTGVQVAADSSESTFAVGVAGAGGFIGGLAGAVTAELIQSSTRANIVNGARINSSNAGAAVGQSVVLTASNNVSSFAADGAVAGGVFGGLAGGVDVVSVRNATNATLGSGAQVQAQRDLVVEALARRNITSYAASGAVGIVGIAGAVSVVSIGAALDAQAQRALQANDSGNSQTAGGHLDQQANGSQVTQVLGGYSAPPADSSAGAARRMANLSNAVRSSLSTPTGTSASATLGAAGALGGTRATVQAGAAVTTGANVVLQARESDTVAQTTGSGAIGLASAGGAVSVTSIASPVVASIDDSAFGSTATRIVAGGALSVSASQAQAYNGAAYAGAAGLASLGAQVVLFSDDSDQTAAIGNRTQVAQASIVSVDAKASRSLTGQAIGGAGGGIAATGSVVRHTITGDTQASVGNAALIGQEAGRSVGSLAIKAESITQSTATTRAVAIAVAGGQGADAQLSLTTKVQAWLGSDSRVATAADVSVQAVSRQKSDTAAEGIGAGGVTIGVNLARSTITPAVSAELRGNSAVRAGRDVLVSAVGQVWGNDRTTTTAGSVFSGTGASATTTLNQTLLADLGPAATVRAGRDFRLTTESGMAPQAVALDTGFAFAAAGSTAARVELDLLNRARLDTFSAVVSGRDTTVQASSRGDYDNGVDASGNQVINQPGATQATSRLGVAVSVNVRIAQTTAVEVGQLASVLAAGNASFDASGAVQLVATASSPVRLVPPLAGTVTVNTTIANGKSVRVLDNAVVEAGGTLRLATRGDTQVNNTAAGGLSGSFLSQNDIASAPTEVATALTSRLAAAQMDIGAGGLYSSNRAASVLNVPSTVALNGAMFKIGAQDRQLLVDADGSINLRSNLAATLATGTGNGTVTVADLVPAVAAGQPLRLNITVNAGGSVGGTGGLFINSVLRSVTISNDSARELVLGRLDMPLANTQVAPVVTVNGLAANPWQLVPGAIGRLTVNANGGGGITVAGNVTGRGAVSLTARDFASTGQTIRTGNNVVLSTSQGNLELNAGDDIIAGTFSRIESTDRNVALTADAGTADLGVGASINLNAAADVWAGSGLDINTGNDADLVLVGQQRLALQKTSIRTNGGDDRIDLGYLQSGSNAFVDAGLGDDMIILGRLTDAAGNRRLAELQGTLDVFGGGGFDQLVLSNSAGSAATVGTLTESLLTGAGLGTAARIGFRDIDALRLVMGSGDDQLTVTNTSGGTSITLLGNAGNDRVSLRAAQGQALVSFAGGDGNDEMLLGSNAPGTGGRLATLVSGVAFEGGNGIDTLRLDDTGNTANSSGTLRSGAVSGFGLGSAGVSYGTVEALQLNLGAGNDTVLVQSSTPGTITTINGGPGDDVVTGVLTGVTVQNLAAARVRTAEVSGLQGALATPTGDADAASLETSTLDSLVFNGDDGSDQLVLDDSADLRATSLVITTSLITGTGIGAGGVGHASVENLDLQAGAGGGNYDIQSSNAGTTLKLYGSTGADVRTIAPIAANLVFDARGGDDQLRIAEPDLRAGKSGLVTLIGGAGNDTLIGSSADDVLYGDRADGEHADDGDDVLIGNLGNDRLDGGGGHDLIFGDQGQVQVSGDGNGSGNAGRQVVIQTIAEGVGGRDIITAGAGDDLVFGGSGNDSVDAGEGRNIAFGDGGLVRYRDGRIDLVQGGVVATDGEDVMKAGAGDDVLFGGGGADRIDAGQGNNALFADGGRLQWGAGFLTAIDSSKSSTRDANVLTAGVGNDVLFGSSSADTLAAGGGNDRVLPTGGSTAAKDPLLFDWTQRLQPSAIASSEGSRQARWLQQALAGRSPSEFAVTGTTNASVSVSVPLQRL